MTDETPTTPKTFPDWGNGEGGPNLFIRPVDGDDDSWQPLGATIDGFSLLAPEPDEEHLVTAVPTFTGTLSLDILPDASAFFEALHEAAERILEAQRDQALARAIANDVGVLLIQDEWASTYVVTDRVPRREMYVMPSAAVAIVLGIDA